MPHVSLVVCVYREREFLERLIRHCEGLYDELLVVHDGPENGDAAESRPEAVDYAVGAGQAPPAGYETCPTPAPGTIAELVAQHGGRFFEGPRCFQQEPHWPVAWRMARHDWILRLDADEFPSDELKRWLRQFREAPEPPDDVSGYTCIWPLWDGTRQVSSDWPAGRQFLFHRGRVRFFGMVEQVPVPEGREEPLPVILCHQPIRKSFGLGNLILRRQAYHWRRVIARSLLQRPTDLPRWRWGSPEWPQVWESLRRRPLLEGFRRLILWPLSDIRRLLRNGQRTRIAAVLCAPIHHALIGFNVWRMRRTAKS